MLSNCLNLHLLVSLPPSPPLPFSLCSQSYLITHIPISSYHYYSPTQFSLFINSKLPSFSLLYHMVGLSVCQSIKHNSELHTALDSHSNIQPYNVACSYSNKQPHTALGSYSNIQPGNILSRAVQLNYSHKCLESYSTAQVSLP